MPRRASQPTPPHEHSPDLPRHLDEQQGLSARDDLIGVRVTQLSGRVDAAHLHLAESAVAPGSVERFDISGATFNDVRVEELRAVELVARDTRWTGVEFDGGRIGTIDASRAAWDGVTLRGLRIDYLGLASAELRDVRMIDCEFGTIDLPQARVERVKFENCRADEVDTRELRAAQLDLRGLEALTFTDPRGLSGAWIDLQQAEFHAAQFAEALSIRIAS